MIYPTSLSKSHASAWLFACLLSGFLTSCSHDKARPVTSKPLVPIQLNLDTTVVYLSDFAHVAAAVDSVKWEDGSAMEIRECAGNPVVEITEQPKRQVGFFQLWSQGTHLEVPVFKTTKKKVRLQLMTYETYEQVSVIGGFTNWQANPIEMDGSQGYFTTDVWLDKGIHPYQFVIDGVEQPDPSNSRRVPNGFGGFNSILEVGAGQQALQLNVDFAPSTTTDGVQQAPVFLARTAPGVHFYAWWNNEVYGFGKADSNGLFSVGIPAAAYDAPRSFVRIWTADAMNKSQEVLVPLENGAPVAQTAQLNRHDWHGMIMYFLMVDRFKNGDANNDWKSDDPEVLPQANHFGGDLAGVNQSLDYIKDLGANTIWVSPITPNPDGAWGYWSDPQTEVTSKFSGYHGYWPIASTGIDRRFGTMTEFNALVDAIHANDQNILVDYVANHVHQEHPIYQTHPDWVTDLYLPDGSMNTQRWDEQRLTTWFDTFMPTLDLERPEVYQTMTDSAVWWVKNSAIDGFRHDATKHIPEVFWRTLTEKVRANQQQPVFQIGETYGSAQLINSYLSNGMLDAQFDFNLYDALVAAFTADSTDVQSLIAIANQSLATYGPHHLMGNITGNQDRPRFTSLADGSLDPAEDAKFAGWTREINHNGNVGYRKMSWLMAFIMSTPGIPCIYYGDEIADVGGNDPDNRRMMRFKGWNNEEQWMHQWTKNWISLRNARMSMIYGQTSYSEIAPGLLAIHRSYLQENTWVLINTTGTPFDLATDNGSPLKPLIGSVITNEDGALAIKAWGAAAFEVRPAVR